jgi:hypothetical protein
VLFVGASFALLDIIPQTVLRPYLSGRGIHTGLVLFAYVLGAALFGWYGLFLGPLLLVLVAQAANVVLPELLHGERLTTGTYTTIGSDPQVDASADGTDAEVTGRSSEERDSESDADSGDTAASSGSD